MHRHLVNRGHDATMLSAMFKEAIHVVEKQVDKEPKCKDDMERKQPLYLQLPFNPNDISRKEIQCTFKSTILEPYASKPLGDLPASNGFPTGPVDFDRLQVCYRSQTRLGSILSPCKLRLGDDFSVKNFFKKFDNT